ncbi:MAG: hypothetical protein U0821_10010 [Chloroflexota bacterium]
MSARYCAGPRRAALLGLLVLLILVNVSCASIVERLQRPVAPTLEPTSLPAPAPVTSPAPFTLLPTPSPPPIAQPTAIERVAAATPPPTASPRPSRARVVNTQGQGANLRAEPSPSAARVKTVRDAAELEITGPERESAGRRWLPVRDPADGAAGWIAAEFLEILASGVEGGVNRPAPAASPQATTRAGSPEPLPASRPVSDQDRAYIATVQARVEALGPQLTTVNDLLGSAQARPETLTDPNWRQRGAAVAADLGETARALRAARPGPSTAEVGARVARLADRADDLGRQIALIGDTRDVTQIGNARRMVLETLSAVNQVGASVLDLR